MDVYHQLRETRKKRGMTQAQLSHLLGLPQSYISQVEQGRHDIKSSTLMDWARILDFELMLVPRTEVQAITYWLSAPNQHETVPPAYGALPDEIE
jgi:HTH-type transcriptional regulator/antitoxin HipB